MRKLFLFGFLTILLFSCHRKEEFENETTARDYSIDKNQAFSDSFLDSLTVEKYISDNNLSEDYGRRIISFYNARNYQFAWFSNKGLSEHGRSFWYLEQYNSNVKNDSSFYNKDLSKKMNYLTSDEPLTISLADRSIILTEITLTHHFIQYILKNYPNQQIKRKEMEHFVPTKKVETLYLADSIVTKKHKSNKYFTDKIPAFKQLQNHLQIYLKIAQKGGWQSIDQKNVKITKGESKPFIKAIKSRLYVTGELPRLDTSTIFDASLETAIKLYQTSHGLTADGKISLELIEDMNKPVVKRIQQLLINMDRMRWRLGEGDSNLIVVNIPAFVLQVNEGRNLVFEMPVVVGKEGHNTTLFTSMLNQVVFSPYWNLTPNIVKNEILPSMQKDPGYLEQNNMEITGNEDGLPVIRQLPGEKNSLGKVKFLFPNNFDIYLHDTPAKALFNADNRAYSHGCIRLSDPMKLASYVLRKQAEWTPEKIGDAMNKGVEQYVQVKFPIQIQITYFTAWVNEGGILNFRNDIYDHDSDLASKMFTNSLY